MVVDSLSALVGPAAGGQIRIVAVASSKRLGQMPDVPAIAETIPDFAATAWLALVGPRGMPADLARQTADDVQSVLSDPIMISKMNEIGTYTRRMTAEELTQFIETERLKWAPVVKAFGSAN
jgi:tripartite-type tricarboxylate transporter receptor subunit TctC